MNYTHVFKEKNNNIHKILKLDTSTMKKSEIRHINFENFDNFKLLIRFLQEKSDLTHDLVSRLPQRETEQVSILFQ